MYEWIESTFPSNGSRVKHAQYIVNPVCGMKFASLYFTRTGTGPRSDITCKACSARLERWGM